MCLTILLIWLILKGCFAEAKKNHQRISKLILDLKPDLILIDALVTIATAINLGIPYVLICK